jgi:hypothetical protein
MEKLKVIGSKVKNNPQFVGLFIAWIMVILMALRCV